MKAYNDCDFIGNNSYSLKLHKNLNEVKSLNTKDLYEKDDYDHSIYYTDKECTQPYTGHVEDYWDGKLCWESDIVNGYGEEEIEEYIDKLKVFPNMIVKFGRYVPYHEKHFDELLGIYLASDNQYAERIS